MAVFNGKSLPFVCYNGRKILESFTMYEKPTLVAPYLSLNADVLTITDTGNSNVNGKVEYDLYVNDDLLITTSSKTINLLDYIKVAGTFNLKVQAKATDYNPSEFSNVVEWTYTIVEYVSLGDSIAAGQGIESDDIYQAPACWDWQYGKLSETEIISGCYTDRIRNKLQEKHGKSYVNARSFARSGDTVQVLMADQLNNKTVQEAIKKADVVTICIGANDILGAVSGDAITNYFLGDDNGIKKIEDTVATSLSNLNNDSYTYSYAKLINKLYTLNSKAQYVFTTVYNPYKYLHIDKNGFFSPLLNTIPDITILGLDIDGYLKNQLLSIELVEQVTQRFNYLSGWVEVRINELNRIIRDKVNNFNKSNFIVAETKQLFDGFPDRPYKAEINYNDLVSVEYTQGYDTAQMDWGQLYSKTGKSAYNYWVDIVTPNVSTSGIDYVGIFEDLLPDLVNYVFMPDMDPHPESDGQYILSRSFEDALGLSSLDRYTIEYKANGGNGSMSSRVVTGVDGLAVYTTIDSRTITEQTGYYFTGWKDQNGKTYSNEQIISLTSNINLSAQWAIYQYTVNFYKSLNDYARNFYVAAGRDVDNETGIQEIYGCDISTDGGNTYTTLATSNYRGNFTLSGNKLISSKQYPYGTKFRVWVTYTRGDSYDIPFVGTQYQYKETTSHIYVNGSLHKSEYKPTYEITLTSNTNINFEWVLSGTVYVDATANWNCYITK